LKSMIQSLRTQVAQSWTQKRLWRAITWSAVMLLLIPAAFAQTASSISGTVQDTANALVPGAKVVLTNEGNKAERTASSNGTGFFNFVAVAPGTYTVKIVKAGFEAWSVTGIEVHPGDSLTVPKIKLEIGVVTQSVTVTADVAGVTLNSGEHSTLITSAQISRLSTVGRDANELISMLPGFSVINTGGVDNVGADYQTMGFGSGNLNSFSANGSAPQQGAVNVTSDGANLIDPGDRGGQISNVNMEQVQEVKVQTSNFGADQAKGPIVISAVGKSGGSSYHGSIYGLYRNYGLNSNEWVSKKDGVPRAETKYLYPGGNFGGPVLIPGTHFNQSKRLVFWAGYEYYRQDNLNGLETAYVPFNGKANVLDPTGSLNMLAGDFKEATIAQSLNLDPTLLAANCDITSQPTTSTSTVWQTYLNVAGVCAQPGNSNDYDVADKSIIDGKILNFDPGVAAYTKFWPTPNHIPRPVLKADGSTAAATEGFNWVNNNVGTSNGFQLHSRVDDNISDSLKLYVTYNWEKVNSTNTESSSYDYSVGSNIPLPTAFDSHTGAQYLTLNVVKTIGTSLTNELTASTVYFKEPAQYEDRSKVEDGGTPWAAAGYSGGVTPQLMYGSGTKNQKLSQTFLPQVGGWETGVVNVPSFAAAYVPADTGQFINKYSWNVTDNVTKVFKTHSVKAGFYAEQTANNSSTLGSAENGYANYMHWGSCYVNETTPTLSGKPDQIQTGNEITQFLEGCPLGYTQTNTDPNNNLRFTSIEGYVTDEWKVNSKLTVTAGIRLSHLTPWTDRHGVGIAVWEPSQLTPGVFLPMTSDPNTWKGFSWHQKDPSIPVAGVPTRALFYSPRFSLAYDLRGNGKTVIRGGWGVYHFHDSASYVAGGSTPLGLMGWSMGSTGSGNCTYAQMFTSTHVPCGAYQTGSYSNAQTYLGPSAFSESANDPHDDRMPVTYTYNFTLDQNLPGKMTVELAYVGNQSSSLSTLGSLQNQNVIPIGAYYGPDPCTGTGCQDGGSQQIVSITNIPNNGSDFRPYPNYTQINVPTHKAWANYNGLQASLNKQAGGLIFGANYTWSKTLAVRGNWDTGSVGDPIDMSHDYGITSFNRPQVVSGHYSWQEGTKIHGNRILGQALNGWEVSGVITLQSGPDLPVMSGNNFGLGGTATYYDSLSDGSLDKITTGIGNSTWLGTGDYALQPTVTCNPRNNLKKDQFVNGNCFGIPAQGTEGVWNLPYIPGPKFFKWDMSVYKDFKISNRQNLQFHGSGFNFLNHPITSFSGSDPSNPLNLQVGDANTSHYTSLQDALNGVAVVNPNIFGGTIYKHGQRIIEFGFKYDF